MGLLDMLVPGVGTNPFYQAFDQNRGKIVGAFSGMAGAGNDPRMALQGFVGGLQHGVGVDQENAIIRQKQAEQQAAIEQQKQQQNATVQWLQQKAATDPRFAELAQGLDAGVLTPADAWQKGIEYSQPAKKQYQVVGDKLYDMSGDTPALAVDPYAATGGVNPKDAFANEKDLYGQYANADPVKTYSVVRDGYERVRESASMDSASGDMGLLYGIMKMFDPGSVVRESEFATAAQSGSLGQQMQGWVGKLLTGERLTPEQRADFLATADKLYNAAAGNLDSINSQFSERANAAGVDPSRIIRTPETYAPLPSTLPPTLKPGTGMVNPFGTSTGNTLTMPDGSTIPLWY